MTDIKRHAVRHIENNILKYIIVLMFFVAGVAVGIVSALGTTYQTASTDMFSLFENLPDAEFDTVQIMTTSFLKNVRYFFLIIIGGFSPWLLPFSFLALFTCGFSYGYTVTCMTVQLGGAGFAMSFVSVLSGFLLTIPLCLVVSVLAINRNVGKKHNRTGGNVAGYVVCGLVLFLINLVVVPADALLVPEIIKQICASVKL